MYFNIGPIKFIIYSIFLSIILSCSEYNKILKGSDYNLKFDKAIEYYKEWGAATKVERLQERWNINHDDKI